MKPKSKYLITGAAGFIGSHLAEALLKAGHEVVSLDNLDPFYSASVKKRNLSFVKRVSSKTKVPFYDVRGDIRDADLVSDVFKQHRFKGIYHLAALAGVRPSINEPVRYWDVNCTGTARLLEIANKYEVKKMVFASSSSVYGNCKTAPFSEDMFVGHPISPYAATKRAGELLCHNHSHLNGVHIICIRFFTVFGPRQRPDLAIHKFCRLILKGKPIPFYGDGSSKRDYTYISDIIEGTVRAMDYATSCPYDIINLGESSPISLSRLVDLLRMVLNKKAIIDKWPFQPGDVLKTWADISRAREKLGYQPKVKKEEGIRMFVEWLRNNYKF